MKQYLKSLIEKKDGKMIAVASDETIDRHGESLPIDSWELANFKTNPVLMWAHDYSIPPIGIAKNIQVIGTKLVFEPVFHTITQLAREVKAMFEADPAIMNSFSVGFLPHYESQKGERIPLELLEISAVPIPANQNAMVIEKAAKEPMTAEEKAGLDSWIKGFHAKDSDSGKATTMEPQSILCAKSRFNTPDEASAWVKEHGFAADKTDETDDAYRFRQFDPGECQKDSFRTLDLDEGVSAVICRVEKSGDSGLVGVPEKCLEVLVKCRKDLADLIAKTTSSPASQVESGNKGAEKVEAGKRNVQAMLTRVLKEIDREVGIALRDLNK